MYMGSNNVWPEPAATRNLKECLDELFAAAEDQVDMARDILDILHEVRVEINYLIR